VLLNLLRCVTQASGNRQSARVRKSFGFACTCAYMCGYICDEMSNSLHQEHDAEIA